MCARPPVAGARRLSYTMASEETRRQLLVAVAACDDKKGEDTRILELDPADSGLADFFLITSATNDRQVVAIADEIEFRLKKDFGLYATSVEGRKQGEWILLDYVDLVIHVFLAEKRAFYDIERLRKSARNLTSADVEAELTSALKKKTIAVRKGAPATKKATKKAVKKTAGKSPTTKPVATKTPKGGAALAKKAAKKAVVKTAVKKAAVKKAVPTKSVAKKAPAVKKAAPKKSAIPAKKTASIKAAPVKAAPIKAAPIKAVPVKVAPKAAKKAVAKKAALKSAATKAPAAPMKLGVMAPDAPPRGMLGAKPPILKTEAPAMFVDPPAASAVNLAASATPAQPAKKAALKSATKKSKS
jgi:ribosome-associated protein